MNFHLGCGFGRDTDNVLHLDPKQHIEKPLVSFKDVFGESPRKQDTPLAPDDHPEMDTSELLGDEDTEKHLSLTGQLQWAVTLGRWDIQTAVMTMSSFWGAARMGHVERPRHICGHLAKFPHLKIGFRSDAPDMTSFDNSKDQDWARTACHEDPEDDAPEQSGEELVLTHHFNANLMHNVVDGKAGH